jgi:hypothetical protein
MRILLILAFSTALIASQLNPREHEAHWKADAVLWPAFVSVSNDWSYHHGNVADQGHLDKINVDDKKRYDSLCKTFEAWHGAMKEAGY